MEPSPVTVTFPAVPEYLRLARIATADAASLTDPNPDAWKENTSPTAQAAFWLTPQNTAPPYFTYPDQTRLFARHNGRVNLIKMDGHIEAIRASDIGWQYTWGDSRSMWSGPPRP